MTPSMKALVLDTIVENLAKPALRKARESFRDELSSVRPASFPFVSPDTFRSLADCVVEAGSVLHRKSIHPRMVIYCDASSIHDPAQGYVESMDIGSARNIARRQKVKPILIISHGDFSPPSEVLEKMSEFHHIFATNVTREISSVTAIPLGLENAFRNLNGSLGPYLGSRENLPAAQRSNLVFGSFAVRNNPRVRLPLAALMKESRFEFTQVRLSPEGFRERVRDSYFVISPPGRGFDCHRTWEAIYQGAVPVVLENTLAPSLANSLPILSVETYEDFLGLSDEQLQDKYWEVSERPTQLAFMPHWVRTIEERASE